jgi:hypothetical protein
MTSLGSRVTSMREQNEADVKAFLTALRHTRWPERMGRKWMTRDRRVAEKVVSWYRDATGEWTATAC